MRSDSEMLDEVMVVAYGTAKKSAFTGSASVIKSETLEKRQVSNLSNALSGTVSGVQTQSTNGQPGTSATVRIRGIGSMYASNNPLYVVDGIPYEGDISAVNSQDIESMTVLKDAAAAALYGARGANGVILVTTKKGKSGDTQISLDARWGVNSRLVKNYDVLQNANTYMETAYSALYNGYLYNSGYTAERAYQLANADLFPKLGYQVYTIPDGQYLIGRNGKLNPYATLGYSDGDYYYTPDNWSDEMFQSNLRQEYNLSVSGGSDKLSYYLSASYLNDEGIIERVVNPYITHIRIPDYDLLVGQKRRESIRAEADGITFDAFWEKFHEITRKPKTNIGRDRREWKKLSVNDRCLSLNHIDEYYDNLTDIKYCMQAASYLSNKAFMNEYDY